MNQCDGYQERSEMVSRGTCDTYTNWPKMYSSFASPQLTCRFHKHYFPFFVPHLAVAFGCLLLTFVMISLWVSSVM
jgi:hypothetical protein